jgi:hypothetical protein
MAELRTWNFAETHPKHDGPWRDEPDKAQWIDEATDLDCLAVRNRLGAWCGYVGLPPGHPLHGFDYEQAPEARDIEVHGGLTFADKCAEGSEDEPRICHVPAPGRPADVWWLGFDCAHAGDLVPGMQDAYTAAGINRPGGYRDTYRTFAYVQAECTSLASQLAGAVSR